MASPQPQAKRVAVVGGGIAGCTAAWALDRAGIEVELFESESRGGGQHAGLDVRC